MIKIGKCMLGLFLVTLLLAGIAFAQSGSAYDALGIRAGAFIIKPELTVGTEYNDNIYAVKNNRTSDFIFLLAPVVDVSSGWSRHLLALNAGLEGGMYASESDENYLDGHVFLKGRLDATRDSFLIGRAGIERLHDERGEIDSLAFWTQWDEPSVYYRSTGVLSYYQELNRFAVTTGTSIAYFDYKRVDLIDGTSESQDFRDRILYNLNARLAYNMSPRVSPFITSSYEWRRYDESDVDRDSEGYRIGIGTELEFTGLLSADIYGGFMGQEYDARNNISGFWYGMSVMWTPTDLTSVQADAETAIWETTVAEASGIEVFALSFQVDHELRRNLLIGGFASYSYHDYQGADISDKYYVVGPRLTYLWNRNLNAEIGYTHRIKDSNLSQREYTENRFDLALTASF